MLCDICGSEGKLYKAVVEFAELNVCEKCNKFGKVIGPVKQYEEKIPIKKIIDEQPEFMEMVTENYAGIIKKKRESLGLTQKEFANKISEKESVIHQLESKHYKPSITLAKKIERFLKIKLIEEYEEMHEKSKHSKAETFTIGDFIKIKEK